MTTSVCNIWAICVIWAQNLFRIPPALSTCLFVVSPHAQLGFLSTPIVISLKWSTVRWRRHLFSSHLCDKSLSACKPGMPVYFEISAQPPLTRAAVAPSVDSGGEAPTRSHRSGHFPWSRRAIMCNAQRHAYYSFSREALYDGWQRY